MEQLNNRSRRAMILIMALAIIGFALSIELTRIHYTVIKEPGHEFSCHISEKADCNKVAYNQHSEILGIPISVLGLFFYLAFFCGALFQLKPVHPLFRNLRNYLFLMALWATGYSVFLFYIMVTEVKSICIYCTGLHVLDVVLLICAVAGLQEVRGIFRQFGEDLRTLQKSPVFFALISIAVIGTAAGGTLQYNRLKGRLNIATVGKGLLIDLDGDPVIGYYNSPMTIVEFSDFECPACRTMHVVMKKIMETYSGRLRIVHKDFPLNSECNPEVASELHPRSCVAAYAGQCAADMGQFLPYYNWLFETDDLSLLSLSAKAESLGLDKKKFLDCLGAEQTRQAIRRDVIIGIQARVDSTPAFFVAGKKFTGYHDFDTTKKIIDKILSESE